MPQIELLSKNLKTLIMTLKIKIVSDLHLEFADIDIKNNGADVLILSGDICVAADIGRPDPHEFLEGSRSNRIIDFFSRCSSQFSHVIYVMGNHEHYHGDFALSANILKGALSEFSNIYFLDKDTKVIDDVTFIGGTLWTDMNKEDSLTLYHIQSMMNDFRVVKNSNRQTHFRDADGNFHTRTSKFNPQDAVEEHKHMMSYIKQVIDGKFDSKFVVCGHHAPSKLSTKPRYAEDHLMNGGYSSDLSEFILDNPQIKLWTHGHTHNAFDYMIGSTRIVCNPRGYDGYEDDTGFNMDMLVEV